MTPAQFQQSASSKELAECLEFDALEPPLTRDDLEEFVGLLAATICNASGNYKRAMKPADFFPAIQAREEERRKAEAKRQGKAYQSREDQARQNRLRFAAITIPIEAAFQQRKRG